MYSNDPAIQHLIALLKAYGIKDIVVSPGMMVVPLAGSVQDDPFFNVYSVVDERSAAYFANGLAYETGRPVVITCTGATSSRNYLPALTEAYYRGLPIIAVTCRHVSTPYSLSPQFLDRSVSQNDVKRFSVTLPTPCNAAALRDCDLYIHVALLKATTRGCGPVHINLFPTSFSFDCQELPAIKRVEYANAADLFNPEYAKAIGESLAGKKIAVFIGQHAKMPQRLRDAIETFVYAYDAIVLTDHYSNYSGGNKVLISQAYDIHRLESYPDLIIDMGGVCANYAAADMLDNREVWRISEDGELHQRTVSRVTRLFDCPEEVFFSQLAPYGKAAAPHAYYEEMCAAIGVISAKTVPFSSTYVSGVLSGKLPAHSSLHLAILNSCRNFNMFTTDPGIECTVNAGGFGIDGPVSTLVGQSVADPGKLFYLYVGDLAFFYDMNILGNRHIGNNVRILLVNNDGGAEFKTNPTLEAALGSEAIDNFVAAKGHRYSAGKWAESCGFHYLSAHSREEFDSLADQFCSPDVDVFGKPVLFEVFVTHANEIEGLKQLRRENRPEGDPVYPHALYVRGTDWKNTPPKHSYAKSLVRKIGRAMMKGGKFIEGQGQ